MADNNSATTVQPQTNDTTQFTPPSDAGEQGVSNPPDGGQVTDTGAALPSASGATPSQGQPQQQAGGQPVQTNQTPQTQPQTGQPQQGPSQGPKPGMSKPGQSPQTAQVTQPQQAASQQEQNRASKFKQLAQILAGNPQYRYSVDDNGNTLKKEVPVSGKYLGLAIALEALSGAFTGLSQHGPGAAGRAGAMAFEQGKKQVTEQDQKEREQAQQDFTRRAQVLETNLRMRSMARTVASLDEKSQDSYIEQYKPTLQMLQEKAPDYVTGPVKYSDFAKYNVTANNAIPFMRVARTGPDGKQVTDAQGVPQWDVDYYIVKPGIKLSNLFTDGDMKAAKEAGLSWADNDRVLTSPFEISNFLNIKSKLANWEVSKDAYDQIFKEGDSFANEGKTHPDFPTRDVKIDDPHVEDLVNKAAATYNVDPKLAKAVLVGESSQNPNAKSYSGASGFMQLTPNMGKYYPKDPKNPEQNIDAGVHLLSDLMRQFKDDPRKAFAAYYSGPNAVNPDGTFKDVLQDNPNPQVRKDHTAAGTEAHVEKISKIAGLGQPAQSGTGEEGKNTEAPKRLSPAEWRANNHPTFLSDSELFTSALHSLPPGQEGMIGAALAHLQSTGHPDSANDMAAFFNQGNPKFINEHDSSLKIDRENREEQMKNKNKLDYDTKKKQQEESGILSRNATLIDSLASGRNIDLSRIATMRAYDREIIVNEVLKRNPDFNPASIDRAIKLSDEAADESKTGSMGNSVRNVNTAYGHMGEAMESLKSLQKAYPRDFSTFLNTPMSKLDEKFSDATVPGAAEYHRYKVALNAAATDWQNLLNNQHALTDHDKEVASTVANPNATFGNAVASIQEMARTAAIRTLPLNQRWKETMHTNYPNLIEPQTVEALKKLNDPVTNEYLKDMESGGDLVNGKYGVGSPGKRLGDLLGTTGGRPSTAMKPNDTTQYKQISKSGNIGIDANGNKYVIATGKPVGQ